MSVKISHGGPAEYAEPDGANDERDVYALAGFLKWEADREVNRKKYENHRGHDHTRDRHPFAHALRPQCCPSGHVVVPPAIPILLQDDL